ncbi:carotenoid oxygenase [Pleomassaria siparia CBS 279.74]|uniref:Carotenoid oxygenase n=1 Tax=Pleomassaria siparia CBS 279.74 TaxID=1314801 RepID=A0A6G1JTV7_9PLEO|nr:carotenoid oxygenase [Pleomassaria siparia CBS 279.74]
MSNSSLKRKRGSEHPYLSGNFAPVSKTHSSTPCTYTGTIPRELIGGQYVRNGGNPISNAQLGRDAHWFDGDGMLAGVQFKRSSTNPDDAVPHFVNKYILTDLALSSFENPRLKTPILPSIATLVNPVAFLVVIILRILRTVFLVLLSALPGSQHVIKRISVANTNILFHDGRALATCESGPPIRIQLPELDTVGWYDGTTAEGEMKSQGERDGKVDVFGGTGLFSWMREWTTGHPKIDPRTGEMLLFHCNFMAPYVHYSVIPPEKPLSAHLGLTRTLNAPVPGCSGGKMMHDFGVSQKHTVILDLPLTLTPFNLLKNQPIVSYNPDQPARFGVFPRRDPTQVKWFETTGCCIFHTANTWDDTDVTGDVTAVNLLTCRLTSASLVFSAGNLTPPPHPKHKEREEPEEDRRISFFSKYDEDDAPADLEKIPSNERTPLIASIHHTSIEDTDFAPSNPPPISIDDEEQCRLYYYRFSLISPTPMITHQYALSAIPFEFPTANPAYEMSAARYIYGCSTCNESFGAALGKATKIDVLAKMDVKTLLERGESSPPKNITGAVDNRSIVDILTSPPPPHPSDDDDPISLFRMPPHTYAQEARFVSRANPASEDDGYLLFYAFDESQLDEHGECTPDASGELWILDAKNMSDVVAKVRLPQRVPYGLHGNWFSEEMIGGQREVARCRAMPRTDEGEVGWLKRVKGGLIAALG